MFISNVYEYLKVYDADPTHPSRFYSLSLRGEGSGRVEPMRGRLHSEQDAHCRANIQRPTHSHIKCIVAISPMADVCLYYVGGSQRESLCDGENTQSPHRDSKFKDIYSLFKKKKSQLKICTNLYFTHLRHLRRLQTEL